jgi:hypothetical protein
MMNTVRCLFMGWLVLLVGQVWAQVPAILRGQVIDAETHQPIPNAQVGVANNRIGTSTNDDGRFVLNIPATYTQEKLTVALIGYKNHSQTLPPLPTSELLIELRIAPAALNEVEVTTSVLGIVKEAVARIPQNYPVRPTRLTGFYRESDDAQTDGHYQYLIEGVELVGKAPYTKPNDDGTVQILQARKVDLQTAVLFGATFWYAGPFLPHRFDFVHNRLDFINSKHFADYDYRLTRQSEYQGRPVYVVLFGPKPGTKRANFAGKLYIDVDSYAFLGAEWHRTPEGIAREGMTSFDATERAYRVDYQPYAGRWHVKSIWYNTLGKPMTGQPLHHLSEFVTTAIDTAQFDPPKYAERAQFYDVFRRTAVAYDSTFWKSYTTALPSDALQRALLDRERTKTADRQQLLNTMKSVMPGATGDTVSTRRMLSAMAEREKGLVRALRSLRYGPAVGLLPLSLPTAQLHADVAIGNFRAAGAADLHPQDLTWWRGFAYELEVLPQLRAYYINHIVFRQVKGTGYETGLLYAWRINQRHRPLSVRAGLGYLNQGVTRSLGTFENPDGGLRIDGTKMSADELRVSLESRSEALQPKLNVGLELSRRFELIADASYSVPLRTRSQLLFEETSGFWLSRSSATLGLPASEAALTVNGQPATAAPWQLNRLWVGLRLMYRVL